MQLYGHYMQMIKEIKPNGHAVLSSNIKVDFQNGSGREDVSFPKAIRNFFREVYPRGVKHRLNESVIFSKDTS